MSKKKYKVTMHGRARVVERVGALTKKDVNNLFRNAIQKGKSPSDFKPPVSTFLLSKQRKGSQVKLYRNMVFVYRYRNLITTYPLPDKYKHIIELEKEHDKLISELLSIKKPELIKMFTDNISMLISMVKLNISLNICADSETVEKHVEIVLKIKNILAVLIDKFQKSVEDDTIIDNDENLIMNIDILYNDLLETSNKMIATKEDRKKLAKDFIKMSFKMLKYIGILESNNFYLVQNQ